MSTSRRRGSRGRSHRAAQPRHEEHEPDAICFLCREEAAVVPGELATPEAALQCPTCTSVAHVCCLVESSGILPRQGDRWTGDDVFMAVEPACGWHHPILGPGRVVCVHYADRCGAVWPSRPRLARYLAMLCASALVLGLDYWVWDALWVHALVTGIFTALEGMCWLNGSPWTTTLRPLLQKLPPAALNLMAIHGVHAHIYLGVRLYEGVFAPAPFLLHGLVSAATRWINAWPGSEHVSLALMTLTWLVKMEVVPRSLLLWLLYLVKVGVVLVSCLVPLTLDTFQCFQRRVWAEVVDRRGRPLARSVDFFFAWPDICGT